jgi:hypothetical protein
MVRGIQPKCAVFRGGAAPEPDATTLQVTVLAAEATGRMIIAELRCGCGSTGEVVANGSTFGRHISSLVASHPEVCQVQVLVREDLGIGSDLLCQWIRNGWD